MLLLHCLADNAHNACHMQKRTFMMQNAAALWLLFVVACVLPMTAHAAGTFQHGQWPLTECFDVVVDPQKQLGIQDVVQPEIAEQFSPAKSAVGQLNFGYSTAAYWLRCNLQGLSGAHLLEVAYPALDKVEVFVPRADGHTQYLLASDRLPFAERPYPHRNFIFPLELQPDDEALYLRVESQGTLTIPATLWQPEAFHLENQNIYALLSIYYGFFIALSLYNLFLYISLKDRVYLEYVLFLVGMAIGQASLNGYGNQYLWPDWPVWGNVSLPIGFAIAGLSFGLFTRSFLALPRKTPVLNLINLGFVGWFSLSILMFAVSYPLGAKAVSIGGFGYSIFGCWVGIRCVLMNSIAARYYLVALTMVLVGVGVMAARNFGWLPTNFFTMYAMQIGSALDMLLLSFALADRINRLQRERNHAQNEALSTKQKMLEAMQLNEQELENRVRLRTFELEAANQLLIENEKNMAKVIRQDALTGLGNRMALDHDYDAAIARARRSKKGVALALIDLDGFKPVNDSYGHEVGDIVLKEVAARLRGIVRKSDAVIRIGGDEFVLIIENMQSKVDVQQILDKILSSLMTPMDVNGLLIKIGASIGVAVFPDDGESLSDLLHRADMLMYEAKTTGGNRYRQAEVDSA